MKPLIKWTGGKERELKTIKDSFPKKINNYIEPFLGGGAVYFFLADNKEITNFYINDFSSELIEFYKCIRDNDEVFFKTLEMMSEDFSSLEIIVENKKDFFSSLLDKYLDIDNFDVYELDHFITELSTMIKFDIRNEYIGTKRELFNILLNKMRRIKKMKQDNKLVTIDYTQIFETILKSYYYAYIRDLYNNSNDDFSIKTAYFYFIREYCYSSMFRYNGDGKFNVPYGGSAYNKKNLSSKIENLRNNNLKKLLNITKIENLDFEEFLKKLSLSKDDFIFVDPPYDSEFSEYSQNAFTRKDQERLALCLSKINSNVMIVIKNTEFIYNLYSNLGFKIESFEKKYNVNFMNRNKRSVEHLIIKNY